MSAPSVTVGSAETGVILYAAELEAPAPRETARKILEAEASCAGVMPAPATPACWPPSAATAPASAANASNAGAARNLELPDRAGERSRPAR